MPDVPTTALEARGPLSQIGDVVVRKELTKLWNVVEGNAPAPNGPRESHTWATRADLTTMEAALSRRIAELKAQGQKLSVQSGVIGSSGGGADLLPADNVWTGTNLWTTKATQTVKPLRVESLSEGPLFDTAPTVLVETDFTAAVDIQMTSNVVDAEQLGGSAALFVQHRAKGSSGNAVLVSAVRAQMETTQSGTASTNDAVAGYFGVLNRGQDCNAFGVHVDAYHFATGNQPNTYGCDVELFGATTSQTGKFVGYLLRAWGAGDFTRRVDFGFLASPDASGSLARVEYPFSVGSDWVGPLACKVAFDAGYANPTLAGLRIRAGDRIILDGPHDNNWSIRHNVSAVQIEVTGTPIVSFMGAGVIVNSGTLGISNPATQPPSPTLGTPTPGSLRHYGYVQMLLGGFPRWIPFFDL